MDAVWKEKPWLPENRVDGNTERRPRRKVEKVMRERKKGTLRSGGSGKKVTSRKQAIAMGRVRVVDSRSLLLN